MIADAMKEEIAKACMPSPSCFGMYWRWQIINQPCLNIVLT